MYLDAAGKPTEDSTIGYRASGVPGTVRGLEYASQKYGKKPWAEMLRPAIELASKGFPVSYGPAQSLRSSAPGLSRFPESKRIFLRDGKYYEPGETFVQPELGRTLERIARLGAKDFYEGETARLLAKDMAEHGGLITAADLKNYARQGAPAAHRQLPRLRDCDGAAAQFRRRGHSPDAGRAGRHGVREGRRGLRHRGPLHDGSHAPLFRRSRGAPGRSPIS